MSNSVYLNDDQIFKTAPSVFTGTPSENLSKHYVHIPTIQVIEDMIALGWNVVKATEIRARKNKGFQKHMVVFRNEDIYVEGENGDIAYPQVILFNSYDGKSSFKFIAGLFRIVCENGLIISSEEFGEIIIRHMGYNFNELQNTIQSILNELPKTVENLNKMKQIELTDDQISEFIAEAVSVRFAKLPSKIDLDSLLSINRELDKGNDLWRVYNRVQENLLNGDFTYTSANGKWRKAREIKNFTQDYEINRDLYNLALTYLN